MTDSTAVTDGPSVASLPTVASMDDIVLGHYYRDAVSGWVGVAGARYEFLNGCLRVQLDGTDKDGKPEGQVFDWQQLQALDMPPLVLTAQQAPALAAVADAPEERRRTGGPQTHTPIGR